MVQNKVSDTIVAEATPPGYGGIGVVRVSGKDVPKIAQSLLKRTPKPNKAEYLPFLNENGEILDKGIAIYFKSPQSFTGEDVLELQGHGGPIVIRLLINELVKLGARLARPGEFSERAFLNDKIDLLQAEAISDLILAASEQAAKSALRSLEGDFSKAIQAILDELILLRMHVEARIDFPEEELESLAEKRILDMLEGIIEQVLQVLKQAEAGALLREAQKLILLGRPNAGKSSLLNALSQKDSAIVTDIPGTTRDVLKETIMLEGVLLQVVDTAGLRQSEDPIEKEGIRRALQETKTGDQLVFIVDANETAETDPFVLFPDHKDKWGENKNITVLCNKIDLTKTLPKIEKKQDYTVIYLSVKTKEGLSLFLDHLKEILGFPKEGQGNFIARARHLQALEKTKFYLEEAKNQLSGYQAYELMAEELRHAQESLDEITGKFTTDDLLGKIFSSFCIGK